MSFMIMAGVLFLGMSVLAYVRPGRYGLAVLALVAGQVLAQWWAEKLATWFAYIGSQFGIASWHELIYLALVLLPALLVLLFTKKGSSRVPRLFGVFAIGVLTVALLLPTLSMLVIIEPGSRAVFDAADHYRTIASTVIIVVALIDVMFTGALKSHGHDKD